jgi:D-3-phosphoglycerate dehydrogenase
MLAKVDYLTLHIPLADATKGLINAEKLRFMKKDARILNLARGALINETDLIHALNSEKLASYVTDFPSAEILACKKAIGVPHLGASTPEAEDNCAVMAVKQLMNFLESGSIRNSVNYPHCRLEQNAPFRLLVSNRNIPNMVGQITTILAGANINITDLINHHKGDFAYNIIDTEQKIPDSALEHLRKIEGIIRVRLIEKS